MNPVAVGGPSSEMMVCMEVTLARAVQSDRDIVGRLLEFNAYEFSRLDGRSTGSDALYGHRYLDSYWSEPGRFPYLIRADEELAGLARVAADPERPPTPPPSSASSGENNPRPGRPPKGSSPHSAAG